MSSPTITNLSLGKMAGILAEEIVKCIFLNKNDPIPIQISVCSQESNLQKASIVSG